MATRPSFRPRPIDSSKPLPIVRSSKDLRHEDDVVVSRALPTVGTGVEAAELEERHLQQALLASVFGEDASNKVDIPIPVFEPTVPFRVANAKPFRRPSDHYIMFDRSDADLEDSFVDYDADHVDEEFVRKYNLAHKKSAIALSMDALERTMDTLEKLQGRSMAEEEEQDESTFHGEKGEQKKPTPGAPKSQRQSLEGETLLPFSQVRQELVSLLPSCSDAGRREVYAHWTRRRTEKRGAFHRLYVKPPKPDDPNPGVAFRPRGREDGGGVGRRMNTYDNYKRAVLLREEFESLRKVMQSVVEREATKARHQAVSALQTRVHCVANGGSRLAHISQSIAVTEREGYCVGSGESRVVVSCKGLATSLPPGVESVVTRVPFGQDKTKTKKTKRKSTLGTAGVVRAEGKSGGATPAGVSGGAGAVGVTVNGGRDILAEGREGRTPATSLVQQQCVDSFGHDDHGKRFIKCMRYFAGGFMNYGVSPYDHRVFSAASERNTVTEPPTEPKPFLFPSAAIKFGARLLGRSGGKSRPEKFGGNIENRPAHPSRSQEPGKVALGVDFGSGISKRRPRQIRVRARVGRGGRVLLDRVVVEKDRGVKAASYPASVEMGGVYTGGLPLERAGQVVSEGIQEGSLGNIRELGRRDRLSSSDRNLVQPLKPMVSLAEGRVDSDGRLVYWPSRKSGKSLEERRTTRSTAARMADESQHPVTASASGKIVQDESRDISTQTSDGSTKPVWYANDGGAEEELRRMPQYARRSQRLIQMLN